MKKTLLVLGFLVFTGFGLAAQGTFSDAVAAYKAGNYQLAIEKYDSVLKSGQTSPDIYYNLGNAYYKQGKLGFAILNYERGIRLAPGDDDIAFNLKLARAKLLDRIDQTPQFFLYKWVNSILSLFSTDGWTIVVFVVLVTFATFAILFLLSGTSSRRKLYALIELPVIVLLVLCSVLLFIRYQADTRKDFGVIITQVTGAKVAPNQTEKDAFVVHEGLKVKVEETEDLWYKIRLDDGKVGWVTKNSIELI